MPTGYTDKIAKGITFREFAMDCARAFGACVTLRDSPGGGELIPEVFEPSDYHEKALVQARRRLIEVRAMTSEQIAAAAEAARLEHMRAEERRREERSALRSKYEAMLHHVQTWSPPSTEHHPLKNFMVEQIEGSIKFDCSEFDVPGPTTNWHAEELRRAEWDVTYHEKGHRDEIERARSRTEWVRALRRSLA